MPIIVYHVLCYHEDNAVNAGNQNCTCLKSVNSCRQPLDTYLEQHSWTRRAVTAERWALQLPLEGPRVWLLFWLFTIVICSVVLNFNVTPFWSLYNSTSFQYEACEGLVAALLKAFISWKWALSTGLQTDFARQDGCCCMYCLCAAAPCFVLGSMRFEVASVSTRSSVHTWLYMKQL